MSKELISGFLLVTILSFIAIILGYSFSFINTILFGLFLGLIVGNLFKMPLTFNAGISFTSSKFLEFSIIFLAFGININHLNALGWESLLIVLLLIISVLTLTVFLAKYFNCPSRVGWLVGFGTAICGSSAIAALAPSFKKNNEDIGVSIAVVNLYGTIGMIVLPFLFTFFNLDQKTMSMLLGGTLHAVGHVVGAGYGISDAIGEQALAVKLARVALLGPAIIFFNYITVDKNQRKNKSIFNLPWYIWGFVVISFFISVVEMPKVIINYASEIGKILLTFAMVAIGIKVKIIDLIQSGKKGMIFGFVIFSIQILLLTLFMFIFN
jgi:uncharacterized integral membrane protein (TIGR00698 family)